MSLLPRGPASTLARVDSAEGRDVPEAAPRSRGVGAPLVGDSTWPAHATSFVGRRAELAELTALVETNRLVTLAGDGGCGKTRLAHEVAVRVREPAVDQRHWVDLGSVSSADRVVEATARSVGAVVDLASDPVRALRDQLRERRLLLCLDNCEHLLESCADLAATLVAGCPLVTVIATSREPLGVPGETVWRVPSMPEGEAVELFTDRARAVKPAYTADEATQDAVRAVCARLDGIPLAVELAAAWVQTLTPRQIAVALDDRFHVLVGPRGSIARHQTLAASVDWSYGLLRDDARVLLRRLAVLAGSFTLDDARAVGAGGQLGESDVLHALRRLVDLSLVAVRDDPGVARCRLAETIREYALARLVEAGEVAERRDLHLTYFLERAEAADAALDGDDQDAVLVRLDAERDDLLAALEWGLSRPDGEQARRLALALVRYWMLRGRSHEGLTMLRRAMDADVASPAQHAALLAGVALLAIPAGRLDLVASSSAEAHRLAGETPDDGVLARALMARAYVAFYVDFAGAEATARIASAHARAAGDTLAEEFADLLEVCALTNRDRHREAVPLANRLRDRASSTGHRFEAAFARAVALWAALFGGDLRLAERLGREAVEIARPLGDHFILGTNTTNLAWVLGLSGNVEEALRLMEHVLRSVEDAGPEADAVSMALVVGRLRLWSGDLEDAARWLERAASHDAPGPDNWVAVRSRPPYATVLRHLGQHDDARQVATAARDGARRLGIPHVEADALEELAHLDARHDLTQAEAGHHEALRVRVDHGLTTFVADSLDALAAIALATGRVDEAARITGASGAARAAVGYPRPVLAHHSHQGRVEQLRCALGTAYPELYAEGRDRPVGDVVAYVSRSRGGRKRPPYGWPSLTPTEQEVVPLVVAGLSNPEIADRLFMNRSTVKTHLTHIYAKLGVANRAELAALAARRAADGR